MSTEDSASVRRGTDDLVSGEERELRPVGRYEWEQIVRRARLDGLIGASGRTGKTGRATKGAVSGIAFMAVALGFSSYANDRGEEIWPGDATVAVGLECGLDLVKAVRNKMLEVGLLQRVRGRGGRRGEEYRLTLPVDLLEQLEVLTPAQHQLAAKRMRDARRGKRGGSGGDPQDMGLGGPVDTPEALPDESCGGSGGPPEEGLGGSGGPSWGGPVDPRTDQDRTSSTSTDQSRTDLRTAVTVSRARGPSQDPIPDVVGGPAPPDAAGCPHRLPPTIRCPACARGIRDTLPAGSGEPDRSSRRPAVRYRDVVRRDLPRTTPPEHDGRMATVLPFRRSRPA